MLDKDEFSVKEKATILSFANNNMNVRNTADYLHVNHNTIVYRLNRIKEKTGVNPREFYGLLRLVHGVEPKLVDKMLRFFPLMDYHRKLTKEKENK